MIFTKTIYELVLSKHQISYLYPFKKVALNDKIFNLAGALSVPSLRKYDTDTSTFVPFYLVQALQYHQVSIVLTSSLCFSSGRLPVKGRALAGKELIKTLPTNQIIQKNLIILLHGEFCLSLTVCLNLSNMCGFPQLLNFLIYCRP